MRRKKEEVSTEETKDINLTNFDVSQLESVGPIKAKRFHNAGITSAYDIIVRGSQEISQVLDIKNNDAAVMVEKVKNTLIKAGLIDEVNSVPKLIAYRNKAKFFDSGSDNMNEMLLGGFETQSMIELFGEDGAGKTQTCYTTVVQALKHGEGVMVIDCEGTFSPGRLLQIAKARGYIELKDVQNPTLEDLKFIDKLEYFLAMDTDDILRSIEKMVNIIVEKKIQLVVVDGMVGKYRLEYDTGRGDLAPRQNDLKAAIRHLSNIAELLNVCVIVTNQVMGNPDAFMGEKFKPIGGYIVGHNSKYRIKFTKGSVNKRIIRVVKSNKHSMRDYEIYLTEAGISDTIKFDNPIHEPQPEPELKESGLIDKSVLND